MTDTDNTLAWFYASLRTINTRGLKWLWIRLRGRKVVGYDGNHECHGVVYKGALYIVNYKVKD